ncbi:MAG: hypothetical protein HOL41_06010 [Rhodospirillaceae bacterium]|nr:hypothetical protein [Rhodospirillaceae bacterium]
MGDEQAAPGDVVIVVTDTGITGPVDNLRIVSGSDDLLNANQSARLAFSPSAACVSRLLIKYSAR